MKDVYRHALTAMEEDHTRRAKELQQLEVAMNTMRGLLNEGTAPGAARTPKRTAGRRALNAAPATDGDRSATILRHLQEHGASNTRGLAKTIGCSVFTTRTELNALAKKQLIHSTGATASLRWHLGAAGKRQPGKPAKEEP